MHHRPTATSFCAHCGLKTGVWPHRDDSADEREFCCYGCFVAWQAVRGGGEHSESAGFLVRLGVGAFISMNVMLFSLLLYSGALGGITAQVRFNLHLLLWALCTPALIVLGSPFYRESASLLRQGKSGPATLIALGTLAAYGYSVLEALAGGERVYFDTCVMVLVLFTLGRYLEANGRAQAARSIRTMLEVEQQTVTWVQNDKASQLPLASVRAGMLLRVAAGVSIPVDGVVIEGQSQAEESMLTGEPGWIDKNIGSQVLAGSNNGESELLVQASTDGLSSRWVEICRQVRQALSQPTKALLIADKVAGAFVPVVILLALVAVWINRSAGDAQALMAGLAVLVVACPCALGLATPLAMSSAIARLMQRGILVRNGASLEKLSAIRTVALDKTGTLTDGNISVADVITIDPALTEDHVLQYSAALAQTSRHPLSLAIVMQAQVRGLSVTQADEVENVAGGGMTGTHDGHTLHLGNARWMAALGNAVVHSVEDALQAAAERGRMVSLLAVDGVCRSALIFDVAVHTDAAGLIAGLKRSHIDIVVLTGDGQKQAERFCRALGVGDWAAEQTPADKASRVEHLVSRRGPVAMVGDGVNDALALVAADVGIAVGSANDIARETADIVLPANGIGALQPLLAISRSAQQAVITNLVWAFGYNAIAILLAMFGLLQPVFAAALMAGSSLVVVANTMVRLPVDHGGRI